MDQITTTRFLKFCGIGIVAFLVDVVAFQATVSLAGASPYDARVVSFFVATTAAWWLNRTFTFHDANNVRPERQWARFMAANLVGGAVNYAVFALMIATLAIAAAYPVLALAAGSFGRRRSTSRPIAVTCSAPTPGVTSVSLTSLFPDDFRMAISSHRHGLCCALSRNVVASTEECRLGFDQSACRQQTLKHQRRFRGLSLRECGDRSNSRRIERAIGGSCDRRDMLRF